MARSAPTLVAIHNSFEALKKRVPRHIHWLAGTAVIVAVLLTRTWGLHVDEIIYFDHAINNVLGEAPWTGKPVLFYTLNYSVYHLFAWCAGWLHPLILPVFYAAGTSYSLWRLCVVAAKAGSNSTRTFALLLLSAFVLFNATQLMMETAVLPLLTTMFALVLSIACGDSTRVTRFSLVATTALAILMKDTALPAALILAGAFLPAVGFQVWPLLAGTVVGVVGNRLLLASIHARPMRDYGGVSQALLSSTDPTRLRLLPRYAAVWLFFLGFSWLAALWSWREGRDRLSTSLSLAVVLSFVGTVLIQFATNPGLPFPRYAYPTILLGLIASMVLVGRSHRRWLAPMVLVTQLPWITALWPGAFGTIKYWPEAITLEAYDNGGTILSGAPVHGWVLMARGPLSNLSVYLPRAGAAGATQAEQWFKDVSRDVVFFDERQVTEFNARPGAKAIFDRRFSVSSCEIDICSRQQYRIRACLDQNIQFYSPQFGPVQSRVCLP